MLIFFAVLPRHFQSVLDLRVAFPLRVIHDRIEAEAMRLLLYTHKSAKEISSILGFEDLSAFSRFFKKMTGESVSDYRKRVKREELPTVAE